MIKKKKIAFYYHKEKVNYVINKKSIINYFL